ncbi:hypothetical protein HYC85_028087 [Camellia sinensis]|uniref:Uncharacterized protein n=1 Tax=Camellia sinensis TaxID=4442 RepID=A0A7J7FY43_CAMSI|nr:hypothetical protein HYC85_028087 [Camellia sinensis]
MVLVGIYFLSTNTWQGDADVSAEVPRVLVVVPRSSRQGRGQLGVIYSVSALQLDQIRNNAPTGSGRPIDLDIEGDDRNTETRNQSHGKIKTEFMVIDTPSPYNIILGRPWLHTMGAVSSTLHQLLWFSTEHGIEEVRGDQLQAENCSMAAMKSTCSIREPEKAEIENEDIEVLDDVGKEPAEKSEEALNKILV